MFKDVDLSRDVMTSFRDSSFARNLKSDVELSVHVLTQGYWPTYPPAEVNLPQTILELQEVFNSFYTSKHNGRRLQWHPYLGHCTLKANFPLGRKELAVSLLQTIVLLLFNDDDGISFHDLLKVRPASHARKQPRPNPRPSVRARQATGIEDKELKVTLQSLACGKIRVLRKEPKGRDVDEKDVFFFESTFKQQVRHGVQRWRLPPSPSAFSDACGASPTATLTPSSPGPTLRTLAPHAALPN